MIEVASYVDHAQPGFCSAVVFTAVVSFMEQEDTTTVVVVYVNTSTRTAPERQRTATHTQDHIDCTEPLPSPRQSHLVGETGVALARQNLPA